MSFIDTLFAAYGISKPSLDAMAQPQPDGDICAGQDKDSCERKLLAGQTPDDSDAQAAGFLRLHVDLLKRSRADAARAKYKMFVSLIRVTPSWLLAVLVILLFVLLVLRIVPMFIITTHVLYVNSRAKRQVLSLLGLAFCVFVAYVMIPV